MKKVKTVQVRMYIHPSENRRYCVAIN